MPAAYAHYRFGCDCIETLPAVLKNACLTHRNLFDFGVHGPDIFFYYDPLSSNEVNRFGSELHHKCGRDFFEHCRYAYLGGSDKQAMMAYLLGFLAHFTLDSSCHGYINHMAETTEYSHNLIESQYEAFLMEIDKIDPLQIDRGILIDPSMQTAEIISRFFSFTSKQVLKTLKGQQTTLHLFYSPREIKKKVLQTLIDQLGIKGSFGDLFLDADAIPACREMCEEIQRMQSHALSIYPFLAMNLTAYLTGRADLEEYFLHDFEGNVLEPQRGV